VYADDVRHSGGHSTLPTNSQSALRPAEVGGLRHIDNVGPLNDTAKTTFD